jgi:hypothetical protein
MLMITLDNLAHRYNILPSEALGRATSFDLYVLNVSTQWHNYKHREAESGGIKPPPKLTQEQMQAMMASVRNKERK